MLGAGVVGLAAPTVVAAQDSTEARIRALEEKVAHLTALLEQRPAPPERAVPAAATAQPVAPDPKPAAPVSFRRGRPTFASEDGRFTVALQGVMQFDAAIYDQEPAGPLSSDFRRGSFGDAAENDHARDLSDGTNFRRARLGVQGTAFGEAFAYDFLYDFGGSGQEEGGKISSAWVEYRAAPWLRLRVGAFSPPAGLEEAASANGSLFAERPSAAEVVRSMASGDGRTALGLFAHGERWNVSAAITGNVVGTETFDEQLGFVGRVAATPLRTEDLVVHVGLNTSIVIQPAATQPDVGGTAPTTVRLRDRPEMRVDGTRLVDTGAIDVRDLSSFGLEAGLQWRRLTLQAEAFRIEGDRRDGLGNPEFGGWYAAAAWSLTGERRTYDPRLAAFGGLRPLRPFDPRSGQWGAWELGLRYSNLDLNYRSGPAGSAPAADAVRGGEQEIWSVGLNWYLNENLRLQAAVQDVSVDRLSPGGSAFQSGATPPAGAQVGQDLRIYSLRTQYAF